ncbi:MAG: PEP/pyruvate-binding domain-containing protein [Rhodocyclaceae bacterium]
MENLVPHSMKAGTPAFTWGTKAETLARVASQLRSAGVPPLHFFTLEDWLLSRQSVLDAIRQQCAGQRVAVRSSALNEDGGKTSLAGAFKSCLSVSIDDDAGLAQAIGSVAASMNGDPRDQILVQCMAEDIAVSGVIMTYDMVNGAPYYCIDYDDESGRTDIVTGGNGINKGLFVYRHADARLIRSPRVTAFLKLARELEDLCDCNALDIEFGMNRAGELFLFQVRRIATSQRWHPVTERRITRQLGFVEQFIKDCSARRPGVLGKRTVLAIMPDWNPAEIIGTTPRQLAASLYRELITHNTWCEARARMGYRLCGDRELMRVINNHPYIDVRNSFNSLLPAQLPDALGEKLVNAWLDRLEAHPELHDKVEFEIVPTCLDFCFDEDFDARYPGLLSAAERTLYRDALRALTRQALADSGPGSLSAAQADAARLDELPVAAGPVEQWLAQASMLLRECRLAGTASFAVVARHAFIAEALLRSAVRRGALSARRLATFRQSLHTVTGEMLEDYNAVSAGQLSRESFLRKYGHLRPGTYEITSLRYDERDDLFLDSMPAPRDAAPGRFELDTQEQAALQSLMQECGLDVLSPDAFLTYARDAIAGREAVKFRFTRALSDALDALLHWGEACGLSRDDLSFIEWPTIERLLTHPQVDYLDRHLLDHAEAGRRSVAAAHAFRMGHILFGPRDIYVATLNRSVPNFIGEAAVSGRVVELGSDSRSNAAVKGAIVCIENADPGFDWIFTKSPLALITQFGGANSHMAIRCAELGLPAAIGCGEQIYQRVLAAGNVELHCAGKILRPLHSE